jgi:hypothetical protein
VSIGLYRPFRLTLRTQPGVKLRLKRLNMYTVLNYICELSAFCLMKDATLCWSFVLPMVSTILSYDLIIAMIEGWTATEHSC